MCCERFSRLTLRHEIEKTLLTRHQVMPIFGYLVHGLMALLYMRGQCVALLVEVAGRPSAVLDAGFVVVGVMCAAVKGAA